jgi:glycerophosphoryl diester phosphodiesterase
VAHRAGNHLADVHTAVLAGAELIEADVRLFRGRLELRHLKSAGPLPIFWDRWRLATPWHERPLLDELLQAVGEQTELMLDLKGPRRRLAELVIEALDPYLGHRKVTVCARWWRLLEPFTGLPVRRVHSVGTRRQLVRLLERAHGEPLDGVSIHAGLLDEGVVRQLRAVARTVMTWPVNTPERARELVAIGVDGLISDAVESIVPSLGAEANA